MCCVFFFCKQETAYEMRISDWMSYVCSSDLQFDKIHPINKNDQFRIFGKFVLHKRWGRQFQARDVLKRIPTSAAGVAKILAGKEFKGIGPKLAEKIATKLGADLISILNRGEDRKSTRLNSSH